MMGLKQRVMFTSRETDSDIKYEARTAQNVFLRTVYQGLNEKHEDVRRELRPLLSDPTVTDEMLLRQVTKTTNEESERKRRLGRSARPRTVHVQSSESNTGEMSEEKSNPDTNTKDELLHQLSTQVQVLAQAVSSLQSNAPGTVKQPTLDHQSQCTCQCPNAQSRRLRKGKPHGCPRGDRELDLIAANGEPIPYDGWVELTFNLPGNDDPNLAIRVPFLVSQVSLARPIVGFNVIKELILGQEGGMGVVSVIVQLLEE